jgi:hypothetical protein
MKTLESVLNNDAPSWWIGLAVAAAFLALLWLASALLNPYPKKVPTKYPVVSPKIEKVTFSPARPHDPGFHL